MKRYFVETNGYNMVAFVDDSNRAYVFHEECFTEKLTLEAAQNADYASCEGCETAEEIDIAVGAGNGTYAWDDIVTDSDNVVEF